MTLKEAEAKYDRVMIFYDMGQKVPLPNNIRCRTVVVLWEGGMRYVGVADCSVKEMGVDKKKGRMIALNRANFCAENDPIPEKYYSSFNYDEYFDPSFYGINIPEFMYTPKGTGILKDK